MIFYSQELSKRKTMDNRCVKCEKTFNVWSEYHQHITAVQCVQSIRPFNVTGRSKIQIVAEWEQRNKGAIIQ